MTPKQRRFVDEYLIDLNATQAAIRAGYSRKTANEQASRLLAKVSIQQAIQAAQAARAKRVAITADEVINGLYREANFVGEGSSHSARVTAWSWIGRHMGMFVDKVAPVNPDGETPYSGGLDRLSEAAFELRAMLDRIRRRGSGTDPGNS